MTVTATPIHSSVSRASSATGRSLVPAVTTTTRPTIRRSLGRRYQAKRLPHRVVAARRETPPAAAQPSAASTRVTRTVMRSCSSWWTILHQRFGRLAGPVDHFRKPTAPLAVQVQRDVAQIGRAGLTQPVDKRVQREPAGQQILGQRFDFMSVSVHVAHGSRWPPRTPVATTRFVWPNLGRASLATNCSAAQSKIPAACPS